jgi:hypothetical protein
MRPCHCGQELFEGSKFCHRCGRPAQDESICRTLSRCAEQTFERLSAGYLDGMAPTEEAFTAYHLQDIQQAHADRVSIRPFTHSQEALNGADWEWWFYSGDVGFGMRVQAKRAKLNGSYELRYRVGDRLQSDLLIEDAAASGCLPVYVFYNHTNWPPVHGLAHAACVGCNHGEADQRQLGCTIVSALVVQRALLQNRVSIPYVRSHSRPWHHILCDESPSGSPNMNTPHQRLRDLYWEAAAELEDALAEEEGELSIRRELRLNSVKVPSGNSERLFRRRRDPDRVRRRPTQAIPGEHTQENLDGWTIYRRFEALTRRTAPLPDRVRAMIIERDLVFPPDARAAGAVLVDLGPPNERTSWPLIPPPLLPGQISDLHDA